MTNLHSPLEAVLDEIDLRGSGTTLATLHAVTDLAIEIAREGREGRKVGTLFTVGAEELVLLHSQSLILDPLAGHSPNECRIEDSNVRETIKELAQLDGGFVVSRHGVVLSACRYFESWLPPAPQSLGLGTRHMAAASISARTGAIAIVVSESSIVRLYAAGSLFTEILPELWLVHRYMSHIHNPFVTSDHAQNLGILSDPLHPSSPTISQTTGGQERLPLPAVTATSADKQPHVS
jgi:DNA integrity scanning protein DisA with diadenylate cyclase activity